MKDFLLMFLCCLSSIFPFPLLGQVLPADTLTQEQLERLRNVKAWDIEFTQHTAEQRNSSGNLTGMGYGYRASYPLGSWSYTYDYDLRFTMTMTVAGKFGQSDCAPGSDSCLAKYQYPASVSVVENNTRAEQAELTDYCVQPDGSLGPGMQMNQYSFSASGTKALDGTTLGTSLRGRFTIDYSINPPIATADIYTFAIYGEFQINESGCASNASSTSAAQIASAYSVIVFPYDSTNTTTGDTQVRIEGGTFVIHGSSRFVSGGSACTPFITPCDSNTRYNSSYVTTREWVIRERPDSSIIITRPTTDMLFIGGETDTIRWMTDATGSLRILYSVNDGTGYVEIADSIPASANEYVWDVPDSIVSRRCRIVIQSETNPSIVDTSDEFKIKGYILTNLSVTNDYLAYTPAVHQWGFENTDADVWPATWYIGPSFE